MEWRNGSAQSASRLPSGGKLVDDEVMAAEVIEIRQQLIANDDAFQAALHRALEAGIETDEGVRGLTKQALSAPP